MKKALLTITALVLSACVNIELSTQNATYNPKTDARIRLYGQNGHPAIMTVVTKDKK